MVNAASLFTGLVGLATIVSAHSGHDVKAEAVERASFFKNAPIHARGLSQFETELKARGHERANAVCRQQTAPQERPCIPYWIQMSLLDVNIFEHKPFFFLSLASWTMRCAGV